MVSTKVYIALLVVLASAVQAELSTDVANSNNSAVTTLQIRIKCWSGNRLIVDGAFGTKTKKAFQKFLRANGAYSLAVDGHFGTNSIRALQRFLNKFGYNLAEDGQLGSNTISALQRFLQYRGFNTTVDGIWGSGTTRSLQRYLNSKRNC